MSVYSMTGFASTSVDIAFGENHVQRYRIEIRSVNHRNLDLRFRLERTLLCMEPRLKAVVESQVGRGHLDVIIDYEGSAAGEASIKINEPLAEQLGKALNRISQVAGIDGAVELRSLLSFSDVIRLERASFCEEKHGPAFEEALHTALQQLNEMRATEGARLADDLMLRVNALNRIVSTIEQRGPKLIEEHQERLEARLSKLLESGLSLDEARLAQEVAILADRSDVTEEITRIRSHCVEVEQELDKAAVTSGKKLGFIAQELLREFNTIGSKSNDVDVTRSVIDGKLEVEKLKEQVANIE